MLLMNGGIKEDKKVSMTVKVDLDKLLEVGAHYGHQIHRWNPKMGEYIYGKESGVHVFDLIKTKAKLEEALDFLSKARKEGKLILLVGTKKQAKDSIKSIGETLAIPYVSERFLGGTLTNFNQIGLSLRKLGDLKASKVKGDFQNFTKKERLLIDRKIEKMDRMLGGIVNMGRIPDVIFILDVHKEIGALKEAIRMGVIVVGVVDTNSDPTPVDYPIPMNDDAKKSVEYVLTLVKEALAGTKEKTQPKKSKIKGQKSK